MNYYDVIIIGGGMGGLVCGTILSQAGKSVLVLEQELKLAAASRVTGAGD